MYTTTLKMSFLSYLSARASDSLKLQGLCKMYTDKLFLICSSAGIKHIIRIKIVTWIRRISNFR